MTKEIAYKVLDLEADASKEEIQKAYAELSKQYHPEDNPEEFQRINEAYRILIRATRGVRQAESVDSAQDIRMENMYSEDRQGQTLQFERSSMEDFVPEYDFDEAERKAQEEYFMTELQTAMDKLDDIIGMIMKRSINHLILKEELEKLPMEIRLSPQYLGKLYTILKDRFVDDSDYDVMVEQLHLYDEGLLETFEHIAQFKDFIDQKKVEYWSPEVKKERARPLLVVFVGSALLALFCFFMAAN